MKKMQETHRLCWEIGSKRNPGWRKIIAAPPRLAGPGQRVSRQDVHEKRFRSGSSLPVVSLRQTLGHMARKTQPAKGVGKLYGLALASMSIITKARTRKYNSREIRVTLRVGHVPVVPGCRE